MVASARPSRDDVCFGAWCEVETAGRASAEGKGFDAFFLVGRAGLSLGKEGRCERQASRPAGSTSCRGDMHGATRRLWLIAAALCGSLWDWEGRIRIPAGPAMGCFSTFPSERNLSAGQRKASAAKTLLQE